MPTFKLAAKTRSEIGKKVKVLRRQGSLPAILYGHGTDPRPLTINLKDFNKIFADAGSNQLVDLEVDNKTPIKILIHDLQDHPVADDPVHVDLYQVKMTEKLETEIPLEFIGEAPAVKDLEGNLITEKDSLEVRCLPADLVAQFEVDISSLKTFDDVIRVNDIKIPQAIEVLNDPEEIIALVTAPRSEEELAEELAPTGEEAEKAAIAEIEAKADEVKATEEAEKAAEEGEESEKKTKEE